MRVTGREVQYAWRAPFSQAPLVSVTHKTTQSCRWQESRFSSGRSKKLIQKPGTTDYDSARFAGHSGGLSCKKRPHLVQLSLGVVQAYSEQPPEAEPESRVRRRCRCPSPRRASGLGDDAGEVRSRIQGRVCLQDAEGQHRLAEKAESGGILLANTGVRREMRGAGVGEGPDKVGRGVRRFDGSRLG